MSSLEESLKQLQEGELIAAEFGRIELKIEVLCARTIVLALYDLKQSIDNNTRTLSIRK